MQSLPEKLQQICTPMELKAISFTCRDLSPLRGVIGESYGNIPHSNAKERRLTNFFWNGCMNVDFSGIT